MTWPTTTIPTTHFDESTDDPDSARVNLLTMIANHNAMVQGRGVVNGVADLDGTGRLPDTRLNTVPVARGGTGGTTQATARTGLGLGTAATKNRGDAGGVAGLNSDRETIQNVVGAAAAVAAGNADYVLQANKTWGSKIPTGQGWISQGMLKTTTGTVSVAPVFQDWANFILPGGQYGFFPELRADGDTIDAKIADNMLQQSFAIRMAVYTRTGSNAPAAEIRQRYIQASPPYDLGDGEVAAFLFVQFVDKKPWIFWFAEDPPWATSGPTDIRTGLRALSIADLTDPQERRRQLDRIARNELEPVAEGQALKNADINVVPTPFGAGATVVLVDPMGDEIRELRAFASRGIDPGEWFARGHMSLDNEPLKRCGPQGVPVVRARWRRTA